MPRFMAAFSPHASVLGDERGERLERRGGEGEIWNQEWDRVGQILWIAGGDKGSGRKRAALEEKSQPRGPDARLIFH